MVIDRWNLLGTAHSDEELSDLLDIARSAHDAAASRVIMRYLSRPRRGLTIVDLATRG